MIDGKNYVRIYDGIARTVLPNCYRYATEELCRAEFVRQFIELNKCHPNAYVPISGYRSDFDYESEYDLWRDSIEENYEQICYERWCDAQDRYYDRW